MPQRLLLHTCRLCTALSSSRGAPFAARRARRRVAIDHGSAAARRGGDGRAQRLLLHPCRCCTTHCSSRGTPSAAHRARRRVLCALKSVATRCAAACCAPPHRQHLSRCCAAHSMRQSAPSAALRARRRRQNQCSRPAPRRARRLAPQCGVSSWCLVTGALAAPNAARQRSRKRTPRACRARCRAAAWRAGRAAARRDARTATEQSAALSGERVRRGAHFVACRARRRVWCTCRRVFPRSD